MQYEEDSTKRKILVLGGILPTDQVSSLRWDNIPQDLNVADYDTVILDFTPFEILETAKQVNIKAVPAFHQFARHLFSSGSEIVVVGKPFFLLGDSPCIDPTWWLPLTPSFLDESGDTIHLNDPDYSAYFNHVKHWSFCLSGWQEVDPNIFSSYMLEAGIPRTTEVRPRVYSIADNRYDRPIAFSFSLKAYSKGGGHVGTSGTVTWLPPCTELSGIDPVLLLLRERYRLLRREQPPNWIGGYVLPNELPLIERIEVIEEKVGTLAEELIESKQRLAKEGRFKQILYETGEDVLEPLVLKVLAELGASVSKPKAKGIEDGRIVDPFSRKGTIEVKGRSGPLRLSDVRQTHQWVSDRIAYEESNSKGILIANLNKNQHPSARGEVFPANCVAAAKNFKISLMTTTQLFHALMIHQEGHFNISDFWNAVYEADGICGLPELD